MSDSRKNNGSEENPDEFESEFAKLVKLAESDLPEEVAENPNKGLEELPMFRRSAKLAPKTEEELEKERKAREFWARRELQNKAALVALMGMFVLVLVMGYRELKVLLADARQNLAAANSAGGSDYSLFDAAGNIGNRGNLDNEKKNSSQPTPSVAEPPLDDSAELITPQPSFTEGWDENWRDQEWTMQTENPKWEQPWNGEVDWGNGWSRWFVWSEYQECPLPVAENQ